MKNRVLVFLSEILSAKTLIPIVETMRRDPHTSVKIVNDGFCIEFAKSLGLPIEYVVEDFDARINPLIREASVIWMGKSYVQASEYSILRQASDCGVPVMMVIPDMGIDIVQAKLHGIGKGSSGSIPYPKLLLADERTRGSLRSLDIQDTEIVEFGNPYFDQHYRELAADQSHWDPVGIGYFSTAFELDYIRGILPANYPQMCFVEDIRRVCRRLGQPLIGKRHPQVEPALFDGMAVFEGTPLEMIRTIRVAVGSYSTTLLEAYSAGIPTISYQPWTANIREDVFEGRIPIVKSVSELEEAIGSALLLPLGRSAPKHITYNPGTSLEVAAGLFRGLLRMK